MNTTDPNEDPERYMTTTLRVNEWHYSCDPVLEQSLVVSDSFVSGVGMWQTELSAGYQELGQALVEMGEATEEDWAIDAPVFNVANYIAGALMNSAYPAPKVFSHGPKSVVFNWANERENAYLTISAECVSALVSSPERIKFRFDVSTIDLVDPSRLFPAMTSAQLGEPVVTRDGSLDVLLQSIP